MGDASCSPGRSSLDSRRTNWSVTISLRNLACAQGLPGAENVDVGLCLRTLDGWATRARENVARTQSEFRRCPEDYNNSWALFRATDMVTVLQRDLGIHYPESLIDANDATFFGRAENLFLHGVLTRKTGTCTSLPPLYVAIGRRLGYPLKLVKAYTHLFARWDDGQGERFNIECTSRGLLSYPDEHYRTCRRPLTEEQVRRNGDMRSMTARQELAAFLNARGHCLLENGQLRFAVAAYTHSCELDIDDVATSTLLVDAMNRWDRQLRGRLMPGFPPLSIRFPPRRFPSIPVELEQGILHMMTKENLLDDRKLTKEYWEPLRRNGKLPPSNPLAHIEVRYPATKDGTVDIVLNKSLPPDFHRTLRQPC